MFLRFRTSSWILTILIFLILSLGCQKESDGLQTAPDFALEDLSGNRVTLKQYQGHIVVLDFWATWCPPCRASIPELVRVQKKFRDKGVVLLGLSVDDPDMYKNKYLLAFKQKFKMNYPVLRADLKIMQDYFGTERVAVPTAFVINKDGKIVDRHVGYIPGAIEKSIKKLLG